MELPAKLSSWLYADRVLKSVGPRSQVAHPFGRERHIVDLKISGGLPMRSLETLTVRIICFLVRSSVPCRYDFVPRTPTRPLTSYRYRTPPEPAVTAPLRPDLCQKPWSCFNRSMQSTIAVLAALMTVAGLGALKYFRHRTRFTVSSRMSRALAVGIERI